MGKIKVLEEILKNHEISDFSRSWIENSDTNEENIRKVYEFLRKNPKYLVKSISTLEKDKDKIREGLIY